jgi:transcriptional regulator with XRE-family HTH domain
MMESTGSVEDAIKELLASDDEAAREYLKESFLLQAMSALFHARRDAGLTQAQLAERLHTKQSAIARYERDFTGSMTLRRFVEIAIACGVAPLDITLAPIEQVARYAAEATGAPRTATALSVWQAAQKADAPDDPQSQSSERAAGASRA